MKLYLLKRKDDVGYDELTAVLVRAEDAATARTLAAGRHGDEGPWTWLYPGKASCRQVKVEGPEGVLLTDFHAG